MINFINQWPFGFFYTHTVRYVFPQLNLRNVEALVLFVHVNKIVPTIHVGIMPSVPSI